MTSFLDSLSVLNKVNDRQPVAIYGLKNMKLSDEGEILLNLNLNLFLATFKDDSIK